MSDNPVFDDTRRYEIQRALNEVARLQRDDEWTPNKLMRLSATICPSPDDYRMMANFIVYEDGDVNNPERVYYDDVFRELFMQRTWDQINRMLLSMDPLTRVAAMGVYPQESMRFFDFADFSPRFFTRPLSSPGTFGYISGPTQKPLGVGKTDFGGRAMEMLLSEGQQVATNILIDEMPDGMTQVWGMKDMMRIAVMNMFKGHVTTALLDEFPQFISKEKGTSNAWVSFKKLLYLCRKIGLNIIAISQRENEIPYAIQDMAVWHVQKQDKTVMDYRYYSTQTRVVNVPGTQLKFKTGHPGSFEPGDLDIEGMHDYIVQEELEAQRNGTHTNVLKTILEFLDMDASQITRSDLKAFAKVCYVNVRMSQKEIASYCVLDGRPVSQQTVSNWLSAMGVT